MIIKFRIFENGQMLLPIYKTTYRNAVLWGGYEKPEAGRMRSRESVFMVFSGHTDKHGREIFSGDVICYQAKILLVEFDVYSGFSLKTLNEPFVSNFEYDASNILFEKEDLEIIGNACENPELLNQKKHLPDIGEMVIK